MPRGDDQMPRGAATDGAARRGCPRSRLLAAPRRRDGSRRACATRAGDHAGGEVNSAPVLEGRDLTKSFYVKQGRGPLARKSRVHAVEAVTVRLEAGTRAAWLGDGASAQDTGAR